MCDWSLPNLCDIILREEGCRHNLHQHGVWVRLPPPQPLPTIIHIPFHTHALSVWWKLSWKCVYVCVGGWYTRPRAGDKHRSSKFGVGGTLIMRVSGHVRAVAGKITTPWLHGRLCYIHCITAKATSIEQKWVRGFQIRVVAIATECCQLFRHAFVFMFSFLMPHFSHSDGKKERKVCIVVWLQCHFVRELFSYLSVQIISNASANCFNVSTFSKQHDSFSANLQLSLSIKRS